MALVVETGEGLANANCYVSQIDVGTYHANLGNTAWAAALSADQVSAILRATIAIDQMGYGRFYGTKFSSTQALAWPRSDAYDIDDFELTGVPIAVKNAMCEAALIELETPGALRPAFDRGGQVKREKVDVIEVEYMAGASSGTSYTTVTRALSPVMSGIGLRVVRV